MGRMAPTHRRNRWPHATRGWSMVEVLVSMVLLVVGLLSIAVYFRQAVLVKARASDLARASLLAQRKVHEIRRDENPTASLAVQIANLVPPALPTTPVAFPDEPRLAYQFSGVSLIDPIDDADDPRDDVGIARVIVRYDIGYRPSVDILCELRFDGMGGAGPRPAEREQTP